MPKAHIEVVLGMTWEEAWILRDVLVQAGGDDHPSHPIWLALNDVLDNTQEERD